MRRTTAALAAALVFAAGCGGGGEAAIEEPAAAAPATTTTAPATTTGPPTTTTDPFAGLDNDERYCRSIAADLGYESCAAYQADMADRQAANDAAREAEAEEVCGSLSDWELRGGQRYAREQKCAALGGDPNAYYYDDPEPEPEPEADTQPEAGPEDARVALAVPAPVTTEAVDYDYPDAPEGDFADEAPPAPAFPGPGLPAQVGATVERGELDATRIVWPLAEDPPADVRAAMETYGDTAVGAGYAFVVGTVSTWLLPESSFGNPAAPSAADRRPEDYVVKQAVTGIVNEGSIADIWMCRVFPDWHRLDRESRGAQFGPNGGEMIFEQAYVGEDGLYYLTGGGGAEGVC